MAIMSNILNIRGETMKIPFKLKLGLIITSALTGADITLLICQMISNVQIAKNHQLLFGLVGCIGCVMLVLNLIKKWENKYYLKEKE